MKLIADERVVFESEDPANLYPYSPGLCRLDDGRLVATFDLGGPGAASLPGPKCTQYGSAWQGRAMTSDDGGHTWEPRARFGFYHARPFTAGDALYILGQANDLYVLHSDDRGDTWSQPARLTEGQDWHQSACNVHYAHGCVYLVMERRVRVRIRGFNIGDNAPVLMRARLDADLTRRESWTFASELPFDRAWAQASPSGVAVPFYDYDPIDGAEIAPGRHFYPPGWLETNVVQIIDPRHIWHDPTGRTFHLFARAHTGGTGYACLAKVVEQGPHGGEGEMITELETAPSGQKVLYVPMPGGQMRFHILQDPQTGLYWLASTQATDSMTRAELLPQERFDLPNNERRRLQLHYSTNCIDWCFAGLVAVGPCERGSRHYASMCFDDEDLLIFSRSGDARAASAHNGNLLTLHRVKRFRDLAY